MRRALESAVPVSAAHHVVQPRAAHAPLEGGAAARPVPHAFALAAAASVAAAAAAAATATAAAPVGRVLPPPEVYGLGGGGLVVREAVDGLVRGEQRVRVGDGARDHVLVRAAQRLPRQWDGGGGEGDRAPELAHVGRRRLPATAAAALVVGGRGGRRRAQPIAEGLGGRPHVPRL